MSSAQNPFELHTVTPYLIVDGVLELIEFLQQVFDARPRCGPKFRDDGSVQHAEIRIGESAVMMGEPTADYPPMPASLYVYVDDCDATYRTALDAGAESVMEPAVFPHGDRYGGVRDPSGNIWWVVTHVGRSDA